MMFPTLRGGNTNAGNKEFFFGEIDDVLAAADHLARQSYVDANQIYLGGHSTGGTLALLTAETSGRFKAVFAFGPVAKIDRYPASLIPLQFGDQGDPERRLRSPIYWLKGISSPTYLIEGRNRPGNADDVEEMCARNRNPQVRCILAEGSDHFSVLTRVSRVIAARITIANEIEFALRPEEFAEAGRRH
jgi:pimeloyl-ACP methyl ester carboxylesterase